jgi:hypothetical protein
MDEAQRDYIVTVSSNSSPFTMNALQTAPEPLQVQPFAHVPELEQLGSELKTNVSDRERAACGVAGLLLMASGARSRRGSALLNFLLGAALVARGFTGRCPMYYYAGIDTRH